MTLVLTKTGNLALNEEGTVVEWLVKMRRLPESRMISEPLPGLITAQLEYLDVHSELLESRQRDDHVRIVHGDLRPEHVFILEDEEPQIIDCLEFDEDLRRLDALPSIRASLSGTYVVGVQAGI